MHFADFFKSYTASILFVLARSSARDAAGKDLEFGAACEAVATRRLEAHNAGKKTIVLGNGGSAGIASHHSFDSWKNGQLRTVCFNDPSLLTGGANDFGYPDVFTNALRMFAEAGDVVIAISSSGKSPNIVNAAKVAKEIGCTVVTLSAFGAENPLRSAGDINIYLDTMSYGEAEIGHETILHAILDFHIARREGRA